MFTKFLNFLSFLNFLWSSILELYAQTIQTDKNAKQCITNVGLPVLAYEQTKTVYTCSIVK